MTWKTNEEVEKQVRKEHFEKYEVLCRKIGVGKLVDRIYHLKFQVEKALREGDRYLNTIPLCSWDHLAGYVDHGCGGIQKINVYDEGIWNGHRLSLGERVCVLKHVAREYVAEIELTD